MSLGATYLGEGRCRFCVWAPWRQAVEVHILSPQERLVPMDRKDGGYYQAIVEDVDSQSLYLYRLDGAQERPDPASRFQPQGVHGPSQVVDSHFPWDDQHWAGLPLEEYIVYELHVGAFTPQGTFGAIIPHLDRLKELGVTAVEIMPIAQYSGDRNWGYDGVYPFAVQNSYGGSPELKRLVNACHQRGLAVVLDVVYNHLGPEGNYLAEFGPYFTDRYRTLWGSALNYDGPHSDDVRGFFIENALFWITEYHLDALRLDAAHAIVEHSAHPFLAQLAEAVHQQGQRLNRRVYTIAESTLNDPRFVRSEAVGGYDLDAQWNDDFHHGLHTLLTGEATGYYQDFGRLKDMVKACAEGYVYSGQYSAYRQRHRGVSSRDVPAYRFVVFAQNHDQVGNRARSERLSQIVSFDALKLAAGAVIFSPFIPLLFMGEEYGETAPFFYFISHSDPELVEAIRRGRREEFAAFAWKEEPPDPQDETTFLRCKLDHELHHQGHHGVLLAFYQELIRLRKTLPALATLSKEHMEVIGWEQEKVLMLRRWNGDSEVIMVLNFSDIVSSLRLPVPAGRWHKQLDSSVERWQGRGSSLPDTVLSEGEALLTLSPKAFVLFVKEGKS